MSRKNVEECEALEESRGQKLSVLVSVYCFGAKFFFEYGIDFNQFALGILNGNSFIFKALYSFDDKAAVEQIPGLGLSAAAVNPLD